VVWHDAACVRLLEVHESLGMARIFSEGTCFHVLGIRTLIFLGRGDFVFDVDYWTRA